MQKNRFPLAVILICMLCACTRTAPQIQTGDLLFIGIPGDYSLDEGSMSEAIASATGDGSGLNLIHVAILEKDSEGRDWVIDATIKHSVDRHPLDTLKSDFTLKDGSQPVYIVKRLKDTTGVASFIVNAKNALGEPYDVAFLPDNGARYCSELVRDSYRLADGTYLFDEEPMNFKNAEGEMPVYWEQLFALLGMPVPQGVPGTNPQGMCASPLLETVEINL